MYLYIYIVSFLLLPNWLAKQNSKESKKKRTKYEQFRCIKIELKHNKN